MKKFVGWPPKEVIVHFVLSANMRYKEDKSTSRRIVDELIHIEDIQEDNGAMFTKWISLMEKIHSTVRLYFLARDYGDRFPFSRRNS